MIFWKLWGIGWIFVLVTRLLLNKVDEEGEHLDSKPGWIRFIIISLMCVCIIMVGGIANGLWLGSSVFGGKASADTQLWTLASAALFLGTIPAVLTYFVGYWVLGLYHIENKLIQTVFVVTFIASIVSWTIPIARYNQNIDVEKQTSVASTVEHDLYYFCNIPVQTISGNVDGSAVFGTGKISGEFSTFDMLPYWYDDGHGDALYDSVNADDSKIDFIENGETPFIRIVTYCTQEVQIDNNTGEQTILETNYWKVYEFHVPKEIMQYNIG